MRRKPNDRRTRLFLLSSATLRVLSVVFTAPLVAEFSEIANLEGKRRDVVMIIIISTGGLYDPPRSRVV